MEGWMLELKIIVVVCFYVVLFASVYLYDAYMRRSSGEGVSGSLRFEKIPKGMRWMPVVASIGGLYIIGYSLLFVIHPDIQNHYLPIRAMQDSRISFLGMGLVAVCLYSWAASYSWGAPIDLIFPPGKPAW